MLMLCRSDWKPRSPAADQPHENGSETGARKAGSHWQDNFPRVRLSFPGSRPDVSYRGTPASRTSGNLVEIRRPVREIRVVCDIALNSESASPRPRLDSWRSATVPSAPVVLSRNIPLHLAPDHVAAMPIAMAAVQKSPGPKPRFRQKAAARPFRLFVAWNP